MVRIPYRWLTLFFAIVLCGPGASAADTVSNGTFLSPDKAFSYHKEITGTGTVKLRWSVAPGYYLYRSRLKVTGEPSPVESVRMPQGKLIHDPYFGDEYIFNHDVTVTIVPGNAKQLKLSWQGCAKAGLCYPPQHETINIGRGSSSSKADTATSGPASTRTSSPAAEAPSLSTNNDQAVAAKLAGNAIGWTLVAFFGMGLLLTFTPCVLPMVPILSGVIVGAGARGLRGLLLSLAFVLPMALTYAALGVAAALAGANLQAVLQTPAVLGVFAAVFVVLALAMFGLFDLQLPAGLRARLNRASAKRRGGDLAGAAVFGVISAVLVGPCMTAPLAGALLYIAQSGNVVLGGLALLSLGLGMGLPLLLVGAVGAQLLPRPGPWMTAIKVVFGFMLLATAVWMISRVTPASIMLGLWGGLLLASGLTLWQASKGLMAEQAASSLGVRTAGVLLGLWGVLMVIGAAAGANDPLRPLAFLHGTAGVPAVVADTGGDAFNTRFKPVPDLHVLNRDIDRAKNQGQWTLVDFYADWCVSCKIIDRTVFGNPKVQSALAGAQLLRPDVTDDNPTTRALMRQLGVVGPPTILFFGPDGRERRAARIVGELDAGAFLKHWRHVSRSDTAETTSTDSS
ncbi:MAG: protein-disulfide reductase DsbD [Salinisphaera sp.]|jgi:thiol:disulfide interchange protein DsbD|nr:protein-disulfide reductase DsbD [Salinisphaera sp.]